jgi:acetate kinase
MSQESKDLRDLADKIENLTRAHPAYQMAHRIVDNAVDHLIAIARTIELRR